MSAGGKGWAAIARRIRVPLGFLLAIVYCWLARPRLWSLIAGACVVLPGVWLRAVASGHVQKNQKITSSGPYAYTRNPLYLGSIVIAVGFALAARSIWIVIVLATLFLLVYVPVIRSEEAYLRSQFPGYENYAQRVPRLLPRLRPATDLARGEAAFSRELYLKHREYNTLLGVAAMIVALIVKIIWFNQ
ncbi:MAG TPA: isoprenylcysteine carboxylmethyltransferase family protein [Terriglobales bacterium]|jgi:protein-S-isoprenylcysteine O-methyltransferase Ste14|nr:isoprenylcysteine carboxylmethyltransferase family protein [Terriglobales bacterium]